MKILGIDPGTHRIGYGLIEQEGSKWQTLDFGCIQPKQHAEPGGHLLEIEQALTDLINQYQPDIAAVESLHFVQNVTTGLKVAEARGVILLTLCRHHLAYTEYKPNHIKATVAGYGMADKHQVQRMVQLTLKLPSLPKPDDAADGLAIALCHAIHSRGLSIINS